LTLKQRQLSRVALASRHSLITGLLFILVAALICPTSQGISLSRFILSSFLIVVLLKGVQIEEKEYLHRLGILRYSNYTRLVPNMVLPDFKVLFTLTEIELKELRASVQAISDYKPDQNSSQLIQECHDAAISAMDLKQGKPSLAQAMESSVNPEDAMSYQLNRDKVE